MQEGVLVRESLWREHSAWLVLASSKVCGKSRSGRACGPTWFQWTVSLRTASTEWNVPGKYRPHGELFFFLIQKETAIVPNSEAVCPFFHADIRTPFFTAEVLKKCAPIALHIVAEDGEGGEDGCHAPDLGDERKVGCPKSPMWESEGQAWSEDESVSSSGFRGGNVSNEALHVIGLYGPGDKISLFFKDWELAKMALSCHMALDMLCQEMHEVW